jgi:hypothetical protein
VKKIAEGQRSITPYIMSVDYSGGDIHASEDVIVIEATN